MRRFPHTRLRRNRTDHFIRQLVRENELTCNDLIYPMFVIEGQNVTTEVASMPGVTRYIVDRLAAEAEQIARLGIPAIHFSQTLAPQSEPLMVPKPTTQRA